MTKDKRYGRDALPGYDEPVNIEGDPEELLKAILVPKEETNSEES